MAKKPNKEESFQNDLVFKNFVVNNFLMGVIVANVITFCPKGRNIYIKANINYSYYNINLKNNNLVAVIFNKKKLKALVAFL